MNLFGDIKKRQILDNTKCTFRATPLPSEQDDDAVQEDVSDERNIINNLLKCSEHEDQLFQIINCQEWTEAVNGWKATVPNPRYITQSTTPLQEEKSKKQLDKDNKKEKHSSKKSHHHESLWRNRIEPGTYRYNPRYNPEHAWKFQGPNIRYYTNIQKRTTDPQLLEHIERVREHLEKTLMKKESNQRISDVNTGNNTQLNTQSIHNLMSHLSEEKKAEQIHVRLSQSLTDLKSSIDKQLFLPPSTTKTCPPPLCTPHDAESCHLNSVKLASARGDHKSEDLKLPFVTVIPKKPDNSVIIPSEGLGDNNGVVDVMNPLSSVSQADKENNNFRRPKKEPERHSSSAGKLPSTNLNSRSFEKFPAFTIPQHDQQLNPLTKLTPSMRKVSDDNEVIMVHLNASSTECDPSPSSAPASISRNGRERTPVRKESPQQYLTTIDAPNKNFIHTGISGKSMSPANNRKVKGKSTRLVTKDMKHQARKTPITTPHRLASLGKPNEGGASNHLDSLHRGAFERDTATAIASEILPGISGRKVGVPVLSHRVL